MQHRLIILLFSALCSSATPIFSDAESICTDNEIVNISECCSCEHSSSLLDAYISLAFGKTIGVNHSYSTLGTWYAVLKDDYMYYMDVNWSHLSNGKNGASIGTGVRFGDGTRGCGINLYFDWLGSRSKKVSRVSSSIEAWLCPWEFNLSVYLPLKNRYTETKSGTVFQDGYVINTKSILLACQLATLKIGRRFNLNNRYITNCSVLISAGPYWVSHSYEKNKYGGLVDLDFNFYNLISWETLVTHDPIFNTRVQTIVSVTIPIGCNLAEYFCSCFSDFYSRPDRFNIINTDKRTFCKQNW